MNVINYLEHKKQKAKLFFGKDLHSLLTSSRLFLEAINKITKLRRIVKLSINSIIVISVQPKINLSIKLKANKSVATRNAVKKPR